MEVLVFLSSVAGAGILTSYWFAELRKRIYVGNPLYDLFHAPFQARFVVMAMSAALATTAAYTAEALGGPPAAPAAAAAYSYVISQVMHAINTMSMHAPFDAPER
jgi:hypothetical protein